MFTEPISIEYASEQTWNFYRTTMGGNVAQYTEADQIAPTVIGLRILHGVTGKTKSDPTFQVDRHVVTFTRQELDSEIKRFEQASVGFTISLPNSGLISRTELDHLLTAAAGFATTTAYIDKLLRKET